MNHTDGTHARCRNNARFSAIEGVDGEEGDDAHQSDAAMMMDGAHSGGGTGGSSTEPPPVDYYRASYAFLVRLFVHLSVFLITDA